MAKAALNIVDRSARASNLALAASSVGDVAALAVNLVSGIQDAKKRAEYQRNLDALTLDQQQKLNILLLNTQSETERLSILSQSLSGSNIQRINNLALMYAENEKKKRNQNLILIGGLLVLGLAAVIIIVKKS